MKTRWAFGIITFSFVALLLTLVIANMSDANRTEPKQLAASRNETMVADGSAPQSPPSVKGPHPIIRFEETVHDFGTRISGEDLEHIFKFQNIGETDLVIDKVRGG
ncbi:DUF1573 domain-containing protein [bacterium]|nr:DUF1573 domain-containing protein [candidate division CSSED10-310 bacterium]